MDKNVVVPFIHEIYDSNDAFSSCLVLTSDDEKALLLAETAAHRNISSFIVNNDVVFNALCERIKKLEVSSTFVVVDQKFSNEFHLGNLKKDGYRILVVED